jgi:hypothetical protein
MPTTFAALACLFGSGGQASVRAAVAMSLVGAALASGAPAAATSLHDTSRVLNHTAKECAALQEGNKCRTIRSERVAVKVGVPTRITLACPSWRPYVVGWDTEQHEHIGIVLVSGLPDHFSRTAASTARVKPESLTVQASNLADAKGFVTLFVGCAAKPIVGLFITSRHGVPTRQLRFVGGKP